MKLATKSGICLASGRLTKDADRKSGTKQDGKAWSCTRLSVASDIDPNHPNEYGKPGTVFTNVVCWGELAEYTKDLTKGDTVIAVGTIQERTYTKQDGTAGISKELNATEIYLGCGTVMGMVNQLVGMIQSVHVPAPAPAPAQAAAPAYAPAYAQQQTQQVAFQQGSFKDFTPIDETEDLPF